MHFSCLATFQDDSTIKKLHLASCCRGSSLLLPLYFFPPEDSDCILFQLPQYQLKKTSLFHLPWNELQWKTEKRNLHWQEDQVFLSSSFCDTFLLSAKQKPCHLNILVFSLLIFKMGGNKELVWRLSCYKIVSRLLKKTSKEEKEGILWRKERSRETKHRCILYIFSIWNIYTNSNIMYIYSSIVHVHIYIHTHIYKICISTMYIYKIHIYQMDAYHIWNLWRQVFSHARNILELM